MEVFKRIKGFDNYYEVSNLGNVRRLGSIKNLKAINNGKDYLGVCLSINGKIKRFYIHRLVAIAFLNNKENKEEVNHINGVRTDNRLINLEWVTRSENHYHRYKVLKQRGTNFGKTGALNWSSKKVYKLDLNNNILQEYPAVMEAMRITGINEASIRSCIYGKQKTAGGFKWEYKK
jgi:hypothetical protein